MEVQPTSLAANAPKRSLADWFDRLRDTRGWDLAFRAFASAGFLMIAFLFVRAGVFGRGSGSLTNLRAGGWPELLSRAGLALFYLTLWYLIIIRGSPLRRLPGILPNAVAVVGTFSPWLIGLFPGKELSGMWYIIATILILGGNLFALLAVWRLGRSFSIVPQARKLVTSGPYAMIRHPLYLAEETMIVGTALLFISPIILALVAVHMAIQCRRILYEEEILRRAFPEYAAYSERTWRVIPYVW